MRTRVRPEAARVAAEGGWRSLPALMALFLSLSVLFYFFPYPLIKVCPMTAQVFNNQAVLVERVVVLGGLVFVVDGDASSLLPREFLHFLSLLGKHLYLVADVGLDDPLNRTPDERYLRLV